MKAIDLTEGVFYKTKSQRKFRYVKKIFKNSDGVNFPDSLKGKVLICDDKCKQTVLDEQEEVLILNS